MPFVCPISHSAPSDIGSRHLVVCHTINQHAISIPKIEGSGLGGFQPEVGMFPSIVLLVTIVEDMSVGRQLTKMEKIVRLGIIIGDPNTPAPHVDFLSSSIIDFEPGVGEILSIEKGIDITLHQFVDHHLMRLGNKVTS